MGRYEEIKMSKYNPRHKTGYTVYIFSENYKRIYIEWFKKMHKVVEYILFMINDLKCNKKDFVIVDHQLGYINEVEKIVGNDIIIKPKYMKV